MRDNLLITNKYARGEFVRGFETRSCFVHVIFSSKSEIETPILEVIAMG